MRRRRCVFMSVFAEALHIFVAYLLPPPIACSKQRSPLPTVDWQIVFVESHTASSSPESYRVFKTPEFNEWTKEVMGKVRDLNDDSVRI